MTAAGLLPLPISPADCTRLILTPTLALLPPRMDTPEARVMLLAIALQESRLAHRRQIRGPARGLWQFERAGGVRGVLEHRASRGHARSLCTVRACAPTAPAVYQQIEHDDILAAGFARLLLWTDPDPLPRMGDDDGAWALYASTWRPGRPHPQTWPGLYRQALSTIKDEQP